ncbi:MAG: type II toxin-antitoxin system YafQ family toxin [Proteobacteria bacterium]|nr:type II toxin-antitoxin system YafQ family toxin [Pseudomonadota bacterium]
MLTPVYTNQFEKELKRMLRRGKDAEKLKLVISMLVDEIPLPQKYRDHALLGNFKARRECHIEPDWLLIYRVSEDKMIFERTGTHSDLFG